MKYSNFIKIRLNDALKGQIENYVKFLNDSLHIYNSGEPILTIKYKRLPSVLTVKKEDESKEQYSFREATRRLYNLIFLKDQLN